MSACGISGDEPLVEGEDYYREGPYLVFTERYLRKRGSCCESGCRHCPFGFRGQGPERDSKEPRTDGGGDA